MLVLEAITPGVTSPIHNADAKTTQGRYWLRQRLFGSGLRSGQWVANSRWICEKRCRCMERNDLWKHPGRSRAVSSRKPSYPTSQVEMAALQMAVD